MDIKLKQRIFEHISTAADQLGQDTYVIGGYVRDMLLNRRSKDIDIVTVGSGIDLAEKVAGLIKPKPKVNYFRNFGTAQLKYRNFEVEFVGARKESYRSNSRKPIVENGTIEDDQNRRDFTINALALGLNSYNFGKMTDPFNGINDLKSRIIKTPLNPDETFSDDPLRMLRAIRFSALLDFTIEAETLKAIAANNSRMRIVSAERITDELNKVIMADKPSIGFKLLEETGLLEIIFPELAGLKGVEVINGVGHKDNFYHTLEVLDGVAKDTDNLWLRWSALLHDIAKPVTKKFQEGQGWTFHSHNFAGTKMVPGIFRRMKLPMNEKMRYVQKIVKLHMRPIILSEEEVTDSAVRRLLFEAGDDIDDLMLLCEADITSKNPQKVRRYLKNFKIVRQKLKEIEVKDEIRNFQPPVSGELIMKTFNLPPCKEVGIIKNAIKEAILDGKIENNFDEAYSFMQKKAKELGL
ncbi:MAG: HD domain-containing protein [Prolixibacteraceae bacterium]|jgi:poly(A) polymerase|nr:HD domain-containing protein [Prolixibacteraceae bacterium]MDD4756835.1 HD domain-containing protein [Prolixibacteraceae bacterium]NLO00818.1 HD domain-containing protein [Bacteroidales bacterium]